MGGRGGDVVPVAEPEDARDWNNGNEGKNDDDTFNSLFT